jgi:hypothetical protein
MENLADSSNGRRHDLAITYARAIHDHAGHGNRFPERGALKRFGGETQVLLGLITHDDFSGSRICVGLRRYWLFGIRRVWMR